MKFDDDEPLYDHVASDEDYATPEQISAMVTFFVKFIFIFLFFKMIYFNDIILIIYFIDGES